MGVILECEVLPLQDAWESKSSCLVINNNIVSSNNLEQVRDDDFIKYGNDDLKALCLFHHK